MKAECIAAVSTAAGRELRKSEIDSIEQTIRNQREQMARQDRAAYMAMSPDAQVAEAARRAGQELIAEAAQRRAEVIGKINAHARLVAAGAETYDGMLRFIESHSDNKSRVQSLESIVEAETKFAVGSLIDAWTAVKGNFFGVFTSARETMDLLKELHGEDSGNALAKKGAEAWKTVVESMRQKANAVGIRIPKLEDWNIPRSWDQAKVFALGRDGFVDLVFGRANRAKYVHDDGSFFTDGELREFLGHAWESIATDGANKQRPIAVQSGSGNNVKFTITGVRGKRGERTANASRGSLSRQIHLKDAQAYADVHKAVGERDMFDIMLGHVQMTAAETVGVQQFGVNPAQMLELFLANARTREKAAGRSDDYVNGKEYRIRNSFDYITGATVGPVNERVARWGSNFRQWQVASKLGSAFITSIGDEATMVVTAMVNNTSPFRVWGQQMQYLFGLKDMNMARRAGLGVDSVIGALNRFGYENTVRSLPAKLANAVMKLSLLNRITDARKAAYGSVMYSDIGALNQKVAKLSDLHPEDNRVLLGKGITERDWAIWKLAKREDWGAGTHDVLTPASIMRISDADMDTALRTEAAQNQAELQKGLDSLAQKDAQEAIWLQKRQDRLDDTRTRLFDDLSQYADRRDVHIAELRQRGDDLRGLMEAKTDEAEIAFEVSKYAAAEAAQGRVVEIIQDVETGALESDTVASREAWRASLQSARGGAMSGRTLGRLQAQATARVKAFEARIRRAEAAASKEINDKAESVGRRVSSLVAELDAFTQRMKERQAKRQDVAARMRVALRKDFETVRALARSEAMQKLVGATLEEVDTATFTPRMSERARTRGALGNLQPGTYGGEGLQTVMIFKSYPFWMLKRNIERMMGYQSYASRFGYAGAMLITTTFAGMLAVQVSQILQGKDPKDMFDKKTARNTWLTALLKGGALGIYGDFLLSPTTRYGQSPVIQFLGPGVGTISDLSDLTIGNIRRGAEGKDVQFGAGAISLLKGNTPGASLWYAKAALDHWIFQQLQESLSPGYLRKTKARAQREFGDSYWWEPGEAMPDRPPNLATAVGQ